MKIKNLKDYLNSDIPFYEYSNENFLDFLSAVKFNFDIPFIQVTGTAGKSIIVNLLSNIYDSNNYSVGKVLSHDLENFSDENEKYASFAAIFENYWKQINKYELTKYEVLFFCSLVSFKQAKNDLAIFEAYMGGYFDTCNIHETAILTVFNNAGLEHTEILGKSASEIAYSKCGIIKPDQIVVSNTFEDDIDFVVNEECKANKINLVKVAEFYDYNLIDYKYLEVQYFPFPKFKVNTTALYNRENIACALEVVNQLNPTFPISNENIQNGLLKDIGYGYFDIKKIDGKTVVCDKANNPFAIEKLCKSFIFSLEDTFEDSAILFAVDYDKNLEKMLATLTRISHNIVLTTFNGENIRDEEGFFLFLDDYIYKMDCKDAFEYLMSDESIKNILITGNEKFVQLMEEFIGVRSGN